MKNGAVPKHLSYRGGRRPVADRGFTLIELLIVMVIIGILAAVAYPSYEKSVATSRRSDAEGALEGFANAMERFYTETGSYQGAATGNTNSGAPLASVYPSQAPLDGTTKYYNLTVNATTTSSYVLSATPTGSQANDRCGTLTLSNTGAKGAAAGQSDCWSK